MLLQQFTENILVVSASDTASPAKDSWLPGQGNKVPHATVLCFDLFNYLYSDVFEKSCLNMITDYFVQLCPLQTFHGTFTLLNYLLYFPIKLSIYH